MPGAKSSGRIWLLSRCAVVDSLLAAAFRGTLVTPLVSEGEVIVHSEAEVRGLFVLLRSKTHPEGFRYELLVTGLTDRGKSFDLTASLNSSFLDPGGQPAGDSKSATK